MEKGSEKQHPDSILPSLQALAFVCPVCQGNLSVIEDAYHCGGCEKTYRLHGGIPDFRVFPDPYLNFEEDYDRTEIVLAALNKHTLESLLEYYWSLSDVTPVVLREKFIRSALLGEEKAQRIMQILENPALRVPRSAKKVIEIGSGTGSFLLTAAGRYQEVVGIDIGMRWLHVSRRRFMDSGLPVPPLVCCCAESLPFRDGIFDLAIASATLEFARDQLKVLSESSRVLKADGVFYANTVNRYSVGKDPYVYLWGVGFLPRVWQAKYVRLMRNASYENIKLFSFFELSRMAKRYFSSQELILPDIAESALNHFSWFTRFQIHVYRALKKLPGFRLLLKYFGPGWDAIFYKRSPS